MTKIHPFLMFEGKAEEAIKFYTSIVADSEIISISYYGPEEGEREGTVFQAFFRLKDQEFMCIDSHVNHKFTFTPSFSLFVTCDTEEELQHLCTSLSENGKILMPLDAYPFSQKFAWVEDKYGVSWQLNLPFAE